MRIAVSVKPPWQLDRSRDSDPQRIFYSSSSSVRGKRIGRICAKIHAVVHAAYPKRLCQLARSRAQSRHIVRAPQSLHLLNAINGLQGADQHESQTLPFDENVEHPMHAVAEVDVCRSSPMARDKRSCAWAKGCVGGFVPFSIVGFRLDHDPAKRTPRESAAHEVPRAAQRITLEERTL
jgi:hypothetical protein